MAHLLSSPACLACTPHVASIYMERMIASLVLSHLSPAQPLQVPILPVLQQLLVELVLVLGVERECEAIPRHC